MTRWPMKKERELIELAHDNFSLEEIATRLQATQTGGLNSARRMGIYSKPSISKLKAK